MESFSNGASAALLRTAGASAEPVRAPTARVEEPLRKVQDAAAAASIRKMHLEVLAGRLGLGLPISVSKNLPIW